MSDFQKMFRIRTLKAVFENLPICTAEERLTIYEQFRILVLDKKIDELDIGYISLAFNNEKVKNTLFEDAYSVYTELVSLKERTIAEREELEAKNFVVQSMIRVFDFIHEYARFKTAKRK